MQIQAGQFDLSVVERLPALPAVLLDLMRSLEKEDISAAQLAAKIGKDIPLSLRVLKVVNSPFYGLPRQIGSLAEAVMVLGAGTVKSLVTAALFMNRLPMKPSGGFNPKRTWEHGLVCALCARSLAPKAGVDADIAFTSGLLHDIGQIVLYTHVADGFETVGALRRETGIGLVAAEQLVFGMDHARVGARMVARWRLPAAIEAAVAGHHASDCDNRLGDLLQVADALCRFIDAEADGVPEPVAASLAFVRLGLTRSECMQILAPIRGEFVAARALIEPD